MFPVRSVATKQINAVVDTQPAGLFFRTVTEGQNLAQQNSTLGPDGVIYSGTALGSGQSTVSTQLTVNDSSWWNLRGTGESNSIEITAQVRGLTTPGLWGQINQETTLNIDEQVYLRAGETYELFFWVRNGSGTLEASLAPGDGFIGGDYNGDGFVSQADLDLVLLNWGDNAVPESWLAVDQFDAGADGSGGLVSQNELDRVLLNWGNGTAGRAAAVPEPGAGLLVVLACGGAGWLRERVGGGARNVRTV